MILSDKSLVCVWIFIGISLLSGCENVEAEKKNVQQGMRVAHAIDDAPGRVEDDGDFFASVCLKRDKSLREPISSDMTIEDVESIIGSKFDEEEADSWRSLRGSNLIIYEDGSYSKAISGAKATLVFHGSIVGFIDAENNTHVFADLITYILKQKFEGQLGAGY